MARRCGTKAESTPPIKPIASGLAFCMLAGLGAAIAAGVVLLPPYARMKLTQYRRDCLTAKVADEQAALVAYDRMIVAAPHDPVLTQRLAMNQLGMTPRLAVVERVSSVETPGVVRIHHTPRPPRPSGWIMRTARRLQQPRLRRGLLLLAGMSVLAAVLLFLLPDRKPDEDT
ncbi:MAG: hypothetical protein ACLFVH_00525 [Phycisphaerae bacterium]